MWLVAFPVTTLTPFMQLGHVTLDNAYNNDTFMTHLQRTLRRRGLDVVLWWSASEKRIR